MGEAKNDLKEGSLGPVSVNLLNSKDSNYSPSADDLAWADYCMIKFTEASDTDWSSFKESLSEILNSPTEPVSWLAADNGSNDHVDIGDNRRFPSRESMETAFSMLIDDHSDFIDEEDEGVRDREDDAVEGFMHRKEKERLKKKIALEENALLPVHSKFMKVDCSDLDCSAFEVEASSSHDIFKVWDLSVFNEQGEFTKELNKALDSSSHTIASTSGITEGWQNLAVEPMDDLIAGFSELSLGQSSN